MTTAPTFASWFNLYANIFALIAVGLFILSYGWTRFERSGLGRQIMLCAAAIAFLALMATFTRMNRFLGIVEEGTSVIDILVGFGWIAVGLAYIVKLTYQRRAQRERRDQ